jgi:hypothetical protein
VPALLEVTKFAKAAPCVSWMWKDICETSCVADVRRICATSAFQPDTRQPRGTEAHAQVCAVSCANRRRARRAQREQRSERGRGDLGMPRRAADATRASRTPSSIKLCRVGLSRALPPDLLMV